MNIFGLYTNPDHFLWVSEGESSRDDQALIHEYLAGDREECQVLIDPKRQVFTRTLET